MQPKTSKPTNAQGFDQAWKKFHDENYGVDEVPDGWISAVTYGRINDATTSAADNILRGAVEVGRAESRKFRIATPAGVRAVTHFKLKKP